MLLLWFNVANFLWAGQALNLDRVSMSVMLRISQLIDRINDLLGRSVAWLALAMVLVMALIVVLRYVFQFGSIAMQESVMYFNALVFSLGAAYTLKEQGHVRVDIFYNRLSERGQAVVDLAGGLVFLLPATLFILWVSWDYVALSWRIQETSTEASGLPFVYVLKTTLLLLAGLLALQGVSEIIKAVLRLRKDTSQ